MIWKSIALALTGLLLAALPASAARTRIAVGDDYFQPRVKTAATGTTITWTNIGDERHTVTTRRWHVVLRPGQQYVRTVRSGFRYRCVYHSDMTGRVVIG